MDDHADHIAEFIATELTRVGGATKLNVHRREVYTVRVELSDFSRETRRRFYAKERELHERFPHEEIEFTLIDASQKPEEGDICEECGQRWGTAFCVDGSRMLACGC